MAVARITKRLVDGLASTGSEYFVWDSDLAGFGVRVRESGARTYVVKYRAGSGRAAPTRRMTIGAAGTLTPDEARRDARLKLADAATGNDPAAERTLERKSLTVAQLADRYMAEGTEHKKDSTLLNDRSRIERHIKPLLGPKSLISISKEDVAKLQRDIANGKTATREHTKTKGNSVVTGGKRAAALSVNLLSSMFNFAVQHNLATNNPTAGVKRFKTGTKERYLSSEELERLGNAIREAETIGIEWILTSAAIFGPKAKHIPNRAESRRTVISRHVAGSIRLLVLTGCRLREILHLEWTQVDFERGLLFLADSKTGKKAIVLNAPALAVLSELPRVGRFVIAGESAGAKDEKPRSDLNRPWALVCHRAGLEGVRLHDLRHTNASFGAAAGLGLPIIGKLLGHSQTSTTARYAHLSDDPLRRAANRIGADLSKAMGDAPSSTIGNASELEK